MYSGRSLCQLRIINADGERTTNLRLDKWNHENENEWLYLYLVTVSVVSDYDGGDNAAFYVWT